MHSQITQTTKTLPSHNSNGYQETPHYLLPKTENHYDSGMHHMYQQREPSNQHMNPVNNSSQSMMNQQTFYNLSHLRDNNSAYPQQPKSNDIFSTLPQMSNPQSQHASVNNLFKDFPPIDQYAPPKQMDPVNHPARQTRSPDSAHSDDSPTADSPSNGGKR